LVKSDDYARAGVPMLPVVAGARETKRQMLIYTILLLPIGVAPTLLGVAGWIYGGASLGLGLLFVLAAIRVLKDESARSAWTMLGYSILYLFALFALLMFDRAA
jgi:heme o synthase